MRMTRGPIRRWEAEAVLLMAPKRSHEGPQSDLRRTAKLGREFRGLEKCKSVRGTSREWYGRKMRIHTEHERVGVEGCEGDEQAAKATTYVRKLGLFSRSSERGVVHGPVDIIWRGWIFEVVVREGIRVRALPVVSFLQM